ncbi:MAG: hypothetical protein ABIK10_01380 [candidate division WOR-3 bacterium]
MIACLLVSAVLFQNIAVSVGFGPAVWTGKMFDNYCVGNDISFSASWKTIELDYTNANFIGRTTVNDRISSWQIGVTFYKNILQNNRRTFQMGIGTAYWIINRSYNTAHEKGGLLGLKYTLNFEFPLSGKKMIALTTRIAINELLESRICNSLLLIHSQTLLITNVGIKLKLK